MARGLPGHVSEAAPTKGAGSAAWIAAATFIALIALSAALVAAFVNSTRVADAISRSEERDLVARYLDHVSVEVLEAARRTVAANRSLLHGMTASHETGLPALGGDTALHAHEKAGLLFLVTADGNVIRAWQDGRPAPTGRYVELRPAVVSLLSRTRSTPETPSVPAAGGAVGLSADVGEGLFAPGPLAGASSVQDGMPRFLPLSPSTRRRARADLTPFWCGRWTRP